MGVSLILIGLLLLVFLPVLVFSPSNGDPLSIDNREDWIVYENERFAFSLEYPPDWKVFEFTEEVPSPGFHILPLGIDPGDVRAITHHTDITQFSVFPEGYPTEGIFGPSRSSWAFFAGETEESTDYYLSNDEVWATMISPEKVPLSWNEYGFIWAGLKIEKHEVLCFDGEKELPKGVCDPALGHEVRHSGSVDPLERLILEEILRSFRFQD